MEECEVQKLPKMKSCNILGINVNVTTLEDTKNYIKYNLEDLRGKYICVSNVHTLVTAYDNKEYLNIQNSSAMTLPDGKPLSIVSKFKGFKEAERVTGPDLMGEMFKESCELGYTHYFYGSTKETLSKLEEKLKKRYPKINIIGKYSPPFRKLTEEENKRVIESINAVKPDFLWVGLGAPKQEEWMFDHKDKIYSLMIGVGAGFDYHAENIKRAPKWIQNASLEWAYRLIQDPKRLFKRYFITNTKFIYYILRNR